MQPGQSSFDHPSCLPQAAVVFGMAVERSWRQCLASAGSHDEVENRSRGHLEPAGVVDLVAPADLGRGGMASTNGSS